MAQKRQNKKTEGKIDTSTDTSFYFPKILNRVKVKEHYTEKFIYIDGKRILVGKYPDRKYYEQLNKFIITKEPKELIKALKIFDNSLWEGREKYIKLLRELYKKQHTKFPKNYNPRIDQPDRLPNNYYTIPDYFIIWRTIDKWIQYYKPKDILYKKNSEFKQKVDEIEKRLNQISPLFTSSKYRNMRSLVDGCDPISKKTQSEETINSEFNDGLHHIYNTKSSKVELDFIDVEGKTFFNYFNKLKTLINSKLDEENTSDDNKKKKIILDAIKSINIDLDKDEQEQLLKLDGAYIRVESVVSAFIAIQHNRNCIYKAKGANIKRLYNIAKKNIQ